MEKQLYYIDIKTADGWKIYQCNTKEEMQSYINTLSDEEKENISTIYKYNGENERQAWDEFDLD